MANGESFQEKLKKSVEAAWIDVTTLTVTTTVGEATDQVDDRGNPIFKNQMILHTAIDLVDGDIRNKLDKRLVEDPTYAALITSHHDTVAKAEGIVKDNVAALKELVSLALNLDNPEEA